MACIARYHTTYLGFYVIVLASAVIGNLIEFSGVEMHRRLDSKQGIDRKLLLRRMRYGHNFDSSADKFNINVAHDSVCIELEVAEG